MKKEIKKANALEKKAKMIQKRGKSLKKVIEVMEKSPNLMSIPDLKKATRLSEIEVIQAMSLLTMTEAVKLAGVTNGKAYFKNRITLDNYEVHLRNWGMSKEKFDNDAEYLCATIGLFPASSFDELLVLAELDEHNLYMALMWLIQNNRIEVDEEELFYPEGFFECVCPN